MIAQDVDATEFGDRPFDHRCQRLLVHDIDAETQRSAAGLAYRRRCFLRSSWIEVGDQHLGAFCRHELCCCTPDSAGGAGDHYIFAFEPVHIHSLRGESPYPDLMCPKLTARRLPDHYQ